MAATAAAILPSREDPRATFRTAQMAERRSRLLQTRQAGALGTATDLQTPLGQTFTPGVAADEGATFRAAQQRERVRRQVGAAVPLFPNTSSSEDAADNENSEENYQLALQQAQANAQLGLDTRAGSAIRGQLNSLKEQALQQGAQIAAKKAKEAAKRWAISITKNAIAVSETPPWAGYLLQAVTYIYDCTRVVVTIFLPDPQINGVRDAGSAASYVTKKTIREFIPPFSLAEPVGLLGFIFQTLIVLALVAMVMLVITIIALVAMSAFKVITFFPL